MSCAHSILKKFRRKNKHATVAISSCKTTLIGLKFGHFLLKSCLFFTYLRPLVFRPKFGRIIILAFLIPIDNIIKMISLRFNDKPLWLLEWGPVFLTFIKHKFD